MTKKHLSHYSNNTLEQRWLVVGAGAIGLLWYSKLYQTQCKPTLLHRNPTPIQSLTIINNERHTTISVQGITLLDTNIKEHPPFTHVLFCTKSFDLEGAYLETRHLLRKQAHILCLCNGMGSQQKLMTQLDSHHYLFVGITSEGVTKKSSTIIEKMGEGETYFGQFTETNITPALFLNTLYVNNIQERLWEKLAINAAINPLTALFEIKNGMLLDSSYSQLFEACCNEIDCFMKSAKLGAKNYKELTRNVAIATKHNKSSMLQDTLLNRKTEIENICGYLLEQANKSNIELPIQTILLQALTEQIDKNDAKKLLWEKVNNGHST